MFISFYYDWTLAGAAKNAAQPVAVEPFLSFLVIKKWSRIAYYVTCFLLSSPVHIVVAVHIWCYNLDLTERDSSPRLASSHESLTEKKWTTTTTIGKELFSLLDIDEGRVCWSHQFPPSWASTQKRKSNEHSCHAHTKWLYFLQHIMQRQWLQMRKTPTAHHSAHPANANM